MQLTLDAPLDMHLHLREGEMLTQVAPHSAAHFSGAVIMPNLRTPVTSLQEVLDYQAAILEACGSEAFRPYMTLFFRQYSRAELLAAREHIIGIKLYPAGITTQSEAGVMDFHGIDQTLALMEELEIPLLIHGESNGFVMDREQEFMATYQRLAESFPSLSIVMEHITTAAALSVLEQYENVAATVTLHHLMLTLDDVIGGLMQPHLFCKPIAKTPRDREALRQAVFSGHPRLMFGSDSAPHPRHAKECCGCAAGIFSAPVALPMLVQLFAAADCLEQLPAFVSTNARRFYRLEPVPRTVRFHDQPWQVPEHYGTVRPFLAGETLEWSLTDHRNS
ncbi:dihydroorotase [Desulfogranum mediterraneum]|uniref:dihydroorotase n=1 Tax=Desulfogranum mediterraneum TaxID=160661 RepID=UPI000400A602|nr:dihydroorotase [Desulfogranum mediterraneum]